MSTVAFIGIPRGTKTAPNMTPSEYFVGFMEERMQQAWVEKDKRRYRSILKTALESGRKEKAAKELAARTVNKQRRLEGRTPNVTTMGTGNPHKPLPDRTYKELYNRARQLNISGRSTLNKEELVEQIRAHN